jgi:hypothetical protein
MNPATGEEKIVQRDNHSGAQAMGDLYKAWRKSEKVIDVNHLSARLEQCQGEEPLQGLAILQKAVEANAPARESINHTTLRQAFAKQLNFVTARVGTPGYDADLISSLG